MWFDCMRHLFYWQEFIFVLETCISPVDLHISF
jgi:hypothetical protein